MSLLTIKNLTVDYPDRYGVFQAISDVSFTVERGEILGIVGESGAGKSTIGNAVLRLLPSSAHIAQSEIYLEDARIDRLSNEAMRVIRGNRIGMIFQDPMTSLNPLETIEAQLVETIELHLNLGSKKAKHRAIELLTQVGIDAPQKRITQYPHEFSGGMRQRVVIALALAAEPDLIIADEPTTALDVSIQAQILSLLKTLCHEKQMGMILVTHDMAVISETADRVAVMYRGELVEIGTTKQVINSPCHDYTKALISAVPPSNRKIERFSRVYMNGAGNASQSVSINNHWLGQLASDVSDVKKEGDALLKVEQLNKIFTSHSGVFSRHKTKTHAVKDVSFTIKRGETFGIVGESGSGKSTIARLITGIHSTTSGALSFEGLNLCVKPKTRDDILKKRQIQMIFQDPYSSLNARMRVDHIVAEPIIVNKLTESKAEALEIARHLLALVELDEASFRKYPHAFSGGQRQRISIARALASRPQFLICDEPTSALDVSIQAQILNLLKDLQSRLNLTYLFISHDLPVMRQICDRIAVMRHGEIIELNHSEKIFNAPQNAYTKELISLMPKFETSEN